MLFWIKYVYYNYYYCLVFFLFFNDDNKVIFKMANLIKIKEKKNNIK